MYELFGHFGRIIGFKFVGGQEMIVSVGTLRIIKIHVPIDAGSEIPVRMIVTTINFLFFQLKKKDSATALS